MEGARVAVQGFGNVGSAAAEMFTGAGAHIVAIQDHTATILSESGIAMDKLMSLVHSGGSIRDFAATGGATLLADEDFWSVDADVLIPAALEGQIDVARAERIRAKLILEGANGPIHPDAEELLTSRGVLVVPDVICNAGGVTVSYFEWVQDFSSYFWTEDEINVRLDKILIDALRKIWEVSVREKITLRTAAFVVACQRILAARELRGLYP